MTKECVKLRAHHGMCLAFFEGKGYSNDFTDNMLSVSNALKENPKLQIVAEGDIICGKCPNLKDGKCITFDLVQRYDNQVLQLCGLTENAELSMNEFSELIEEKILSKGKRESICGNCQWTQLCKSKERCYIF